MRKSEVAVCAMGEARYLGKPVSGACRERTSAQMIDSTHIKRTTRPQAEMGEQKQTVGRSRGGRNTKIHALADAKGRLIAILLTGGEAHDCSPLPIA
jgi:hypothetical protein